MPGAVALVLRPDAFSRSSLDCPGPLRSKRVVHIFWVGALVHWADGGPTDLANLALVCRAHHRAVHEGGWQLTRGPDGHLKVSRPHRSHPPHRRHRVPA